MIFLSNLQTSKYKKNLINFLFVRSRLLPALVVFLGIFTFTKFEKIWNTGLNGEDVSLSKKAFAKEEKEKFFSQKTSKNADTLQVSSPAQTGKKKFDILNLSLEKIELLHSLHDRYEEIQKKEHELKKQELVLVALSKKLEKREDSLHKAINLLKVLLKKRNQKEQEALKKVTNLYENMKPAKAAELLQGLDLYSLLDLLENFKEKSVTAILTHMPARKARIILRALSTRHKFQTKKLQAGAATTP